MFKKIKVNGSIPAGEKKNTFLLLLKHTEDVWCCAILNGGGFILQQVIDILQSSAHVVKSTGKLWQ